MKVAEIRELNAKELLGRVDAEVAAYGQKEINYSISLMNNPSQVKQQRRSAACMRIELCQRELNNKQLSLAETRGLRKERTGAVTSSRMDRNITVAIKWRGKHPIYRKFVNKAKRYYAHDESNERNIGNTIKIIEARLLSKTERWRLVQVVERAK